MNSRRALNVAIPFSVIFILAMTGPAMAVGPEGPVTTELSVRLSGDQVVPGPGAIDAGSGSGYVMIDTDAGTMCWSISWDGIDEPTSASIHAGPAGEVGAGVIDLADPLSDGCLESLDPATLDAIVADPSAYYLELVSAAYPGGAIRGQLEAFEATNYVIAWAVLSGSSVLPDGGDPVAAGWVELDIEAASGTLCVWWAVTGLDDATVADVHAGAADAVGDAVLVLPLPTANPGEPPPDGGAGTDPGVEPCQTGLDAAVLQAIADDPASFYVDVHTPAYPGGAVRGQLSLEPPPPPPCEAPAVCDGVLAAGAYEFYGFSRVLFFTLADEWLATSSGVGVSLADGHGLLSFAVFNGLGAADACGTSVTEIGAASGVLADWLAAHPALADVTVAAVTIGGMPALQLDATVAVPDSCGTGELLLFPSYGSVEPGGGDGSGGPGDETSNGVVTQALLGNDGFSVADGEHLRLVIVDMDFSVAVIALTAPEGEGFAALALHADGVLDSMTWGPEPVRGDGGGDPTAEAGGEGGLPDTAMAEVEPTIPLGALLLVAAGLAGI
ncbi:MAG: CHRD domain-containing protein, partial [Chloroflexota bacterium]|nr:CHRD domain-containing protein [Chloroflexota bacterium]